MTAPPPKIHFSGIGGTAMVAGARLARELGLEVRGSDTPLYPPTSQLVDALGVPVATGYAAKNLDWDPDLVIIGNALSRGNPEVEAALSRKLNYRSLPEWLKDAVLRQRRPIAVCGTHGKTTTTALTAHLLDACGLAPGYLIGGRPLGFDHAARLGNPGAPFVIEGDEYDTAFFDKRAKFFHYLPELAIVTSIEFDHGDIYPDLDAIDRAFQRMLRQIPHEGWLLACADNHAAHLKQHAFSQVFTYGFAPDADFRIEDRPAETGMQGFALYHDNACCLEAQAPLTGRHNLLNAAAACVAARLFGADKAAISEGLRAFPGVSRRMEIFLQHGQRLFIDDFAHHPTAVRETVAARTRWPDHRLRVLFEPRSNTTVTNRFQDDLTDAFALADEVWLGPIHRAERIPEADRLDRAAMVTHLKQNGAEAYYCDAVETIVAALKKNLSEKEIILILSNGAFGGIYQQLRTAFQP